MPSSLVGVIGIAVLRVSAEWFWCPKIVGDVIGGVGGVFGEAVVTIVVIKGE